MAGHCHRLAFLVGLKTIIVIPRGAKCHTGTGGAPIRSLLPSRVPRTYGVTDIARGSTTLYRGVSRNANKNARKKGRPRSALRVISRVPIIIMAVRLSAPTLTLIRLNEHHARVTSVSSLPFWRHSTRSASGLFHPRLPPSKCPSTLVPSILTGRLPAWCLVTPGSVLLSSMQS